MSSVAFDAYAGEQGSDLFEMYIFCCMYCVCFDAKNSRESFLERRQNGNVERCTTSRSTNDGEVTSWPVHTCAHMIGPRVRIWLHDQRDRQNKRRER